MNKYTGVDMIQKSHVRSNKGIKSKINPKSYIQYLYSLLTAIRENYLVGVRVDTQTRTTTKNLLNNNTVNA